MSMTTGGHFVIIMFCVMLASTCNAAECAKGTRTSLQYTMADVPAIPHHDQGIGRTRFVLRFEPEGGILSSKEFEGQWFCLGYNAKIHSYVIGGIDQKGAWLPLRSIQYLTEEGGSFKPSAFDRLDYIALSAVTSPAGRFIVFVGGRIGIEGLYVLDTKRDVVRKLGPAPAPPPDAQLSDICQNDPFEWGSCWADGYKEMDADIILFKSETELEVSYGKDGPTQRAKKRRVRRYSL
jgi:hypothetical protein